MSSLLFRPFKAGGSKFKEKDQNAIVVIFYSETYILRASYKLYTLLYFSLGLFRKYYLKKHLKIMTRTETSAFPPCYINSKFKTCFHFVSQESCLLQFNSPHKMGRFVVAIQIEDYDNPLSTKPKSSVALQFVVQITDNNAGCYSNLSSGDVKLVYSDDNGMEAKQCIQATLGRPLTLEWVVRNNDLNDPM